MNKELDAIKTKTIFLSLISLAYFICAIYLELTSFAMHGTPEEINALAIILAFCGSVAILGSIVYLIIAKKKLEEKKTDT